jgi:hypothetical protein
MIAIGLDGTESVLVEGFRDLELQGAQPGAGIRRMPPIVHTPQWTQTFVALEVRKSERINMSNLTFCENPASSDSSRQTLVRISRSNAGIWGCTISGSKGTGVEIQDKSSVELVGSTIADNEGGGIGAGGQSRLNISYWTSWWGDPNTDEREDRTIVQRNGTSPCCGNAISAGNGAEVNVGLVTVQDNTGSGVSAGSGAFINLGSWGEDAPVITGNGALPGPAAVSASGAEIWIISPTKIDDNQGNGAEALMGGRVVVCCSGKEGTPMFIPPSISNNGGFGFRAWAGGGVFFWDKALVQGNKRGGVSLF